MKKLMMIVAAVLFAAILGSVTGCKSIEVEYRGKALATWTDTNGVVRAICDDAGKPVFYDKGWAVDYFQHWTWTKFDALSATAGTGVALTLNGYESGADSNLVALVKTSFDGAALLAAKVGAAIATSGGSVAADAAKDGIAALVKKFILSGGDTSKATVSCANGSCTITDGMVTESCTDCFK